MTGPIPPLRTLIWRGLRRRCPHCGEGRIYCGWVKLNERCAQCELKFLSDQGDLWVYLVAVDRALFIFPLIVLIYFQLYSPGSIWFYLFAAVLGIGFVFTLPHRNGVSLGLDYLLRRKWGDLASPEATDSPTDQKPD